MRRREFIGLLGSAMATWPRVANAQSNERTRRIGMLFPGAEDDTYFGLRFAAFRKQLGVLGWIEGRNLLIDHRWADGDINRIPALATELVALAPDLLVANNATTLTALRPAARAIPIVFANVTDPVGLGFVASLARPGGNITGFTNREYTMAGKWLEILKEAAPGIKRVAILHNPQNPASAALLRAMQTGPQLGMQLIPMPIRDGAEIPRAVDAFASADGGLVILPDGSISSNRDLLAETAARNHLPAMYSQRDFVMRGGLMSYGHDAIDLQRQAAFYVDRILKGEKLADLPVQAATKFELIINLKVAKTLGLSIPLPLLARADEVIE